MEPRHAFGITAAERADAWRLGAEVERLGYDELWVNDTARGDGIRTLAASSARTTRLRLGVGVVALSEQSPGLIAQRVRAVALPVERLTVGVGSGSSRSLDLVRSGVAELRRLLPRHPLAVAAVGPRMAALAAQLADAVVLNWALPDRLAELRELVAAASVDAGRARPRTVVYVRTAVGSGARDRLRADMGRYARMAPHYARAFAGVGDRLVGVAVESVDRDAVASALEPYRSVVDTVVVRGLPAGDAVDAWLDVARLARPGSG